MTETRIRKLGEFVWVVSTPSGERRVYGDFRDRAEVLEFAKVNGYLSKPA